MMRLSDGQSRRLALALLAGALALVYAGVVMPYISLFTGGSDRTQALERRLERYRSVAALRETVEARLASHSTDPLVAASFVSNETTALALADLQQRIKLAVSESGAELLSTQPLPIADTGPPLTATVRVGLRGDTEAVQLLVYRLEAEQPVAHLDNLSLRALARTANAARRNEQLDVRFDLTGYVRLETP